MNDCVAYGEGTAPPQHNPTSEIDVVYASINWHMQLYINLTGYNNYIVEHYSSTMEFTIHPQCYNYKSVCVCVCVCVYDFLLFYYNNKIFLVTNNILLL